MLMIWGVLSVSSIVLYTTWRRRGSLKRRKNRARGLWRQQQELESIPLGTLVQMELAFLPSEFGYRVVEDAMWEVSKSGKVCGILFVKEDELFLQFVGQKGKKVNVHNCNYIIEQNSCK
ncbi:MAG: hypothetical protein ACRCWQ_03055 [Bacilli bacterium]